MVAAKKKQFSRGSAVSESRRKAIAAIQILWQKMRPDLAFDKEASRDERLAWISGFLGLKSLRSVTALSDSQLGAVVGEMKRLTGERKADQPASQILPGGAEIIHLATREQIYALDTLKGYIGWSDEYKEEYLFKRFQSRSFQMLKFKQANSLMIQMLNTAAHQDLKRMANPDKKISRKETAAYIPKLKRKLGIDQRNQSLQMGGTTYKL